MDLHTASPKSTGGGGYTFENSVDAYFIACLLAGRSPLGIERGILRQVEFQVRVDRWLIDDLLLTLSDTAGEHLCGVSVRSSDQFTGGVFDVEFVSAAWQQLLLEGPNPFDRSRDWLCLACRPAPANLHPHIHELLRWTQAQDLGKLPGRLDVGGYGSQEKRSLLEGFRCPTTLTQHDRVKESDTVELLSRVLVLDDFDFETDPSRKEQEAIDVCQGILASGSNDEARSLWEMLLALADDLRPKTGVLDVPRLLDQLRGRYGLKDYPHHEADWAQIGTHTRNALEGVRDTIGAVPVVRDGEQGELDAALSKSKVVALLGPSGCGKTVIAKRWAEDKLQNRHVLWWDARALDAADFSAFEHPLGLGHPLRDLLANASGAEACVVIDGLDRLFSDEAHRNVTALLGMLRLDVDSSPWQVVLTCQLEDWERKLDRIQIPSRWKPVLVDYFKHDQLRPVWEAYPALQRLAQNRRVAAVLTRPKVLDLAARRAGALENAGAGEWFGESDLVEWFWEAVVRSPDEGSPRAAFLARLGKAQADALEMETPEHNFLAGELGSLDGLVRDGICCHHEERICFDHDLLGDWARQRVLLAEAGDLLGFLKSRISSPLWHQAIRLYALHLLETSGDADRWRQAIAAVQAEQLAQDLMVDAVILAADPAPLLESIWPDLMANDAILLRRLLRRFRHVATFPNPAMMAFVKVLWPQESMTEAATWQRLPYWPYWPPMLSFLHARLAEVVEAALAQVASIVDTWLRQGRPELPLRREAAELGVACGEFVLRRRRSRGPQLYVPEEIAKTAFKAALAGAGEIPDEVSDFALRACQREPSPEEKATGEDGK